METDTRIPCATGVPLAPEDTRPPALTATVTRSQRVVRLGGAYARVRCDERCRATLGGRLAIGKRRYALRSVARTLAAGQRARLHARLPQPARRALRKALTSGRAPRLTISVRARDAMGNPAPTLTRSVRVRR